MGIRIPLLTVLDYNDSGNVGATSIVTKEFTIPQDCDSMTLKVPVASVSGTAPIVDVFLQGTDDGGTTYYDLASLRIPSLVTSSVLFVNNPGALWATVSTTSESSVVGSAAASSLGVNSNSGVPILGLRNRVSIKYSGTIATNNGMQVQVKINSKSGTL